MRLSDDQIKKELEEFVKEIVLCNTQEKARDIDRRLDDFFESNDVPNELNILITEGYGEMLRLKLGISHRGEMK